MDLTETELRLRIGVPACQLLDQEDARATEWATACALAGYAVGAGLSQDEFVSLVRGSDFAATLATENGRGRYGRLTQRLAKAYRFAEETHIPSGDYAGTLPDRLRSLLVRVEAHEFTGRTRHSDRAVAVVVISKAIRINVFTVDMGLRELSLAAGIGRATAQRALERLEEAGLWRRTGGRHGAAQTLNLDVTWLSAKVGHINTSPLDSYVAHDGRQTIPAPEHPAFLTSALGPNAGLIWSNFPDEPMTASGVSELLGIPVRTVSRTLRRMVDCRLLVETPGKGRRAATYTVSPAVTLDSLDDVARDFGTLDWADRKSAEYQKERDAFAFVQHRKSQEQEYLGKLKEAAFWSQSQGAREPMMVSGDPFED